MQTLFLIFYVHYTVLTRTLLLSTVIILIFFRWRNQVCCSTVFQPASTRFQILGSEQITLSYFYLQWIFQVSQWCTVCFLCFCYINTFSLVFQKLLFLTNPEKPLVLSLPNNFSLVKSKAVAILLNLLFLDDTLDHPLFKILFSVFVTSCPFCHPHIYLNVNSFFCIIILSDSFSIWDISAEDKNPKAKNRTFMPTSLES